ncbi:MAG: SDR family oxidoreductase [Burkholderiales bacterium]|nr:SDR family oxidoreductase [Burkholderiales bacterium]
MHELRDKVAVVSGATRKRGLGAAIALALARAGANVVVTGSGHSAGGAPEDEVKSGWRGLPDLVAAIEALGVRGHGVHADVTHIGEVQNMVAQTVERFGHIDILVNNATYPRAADRVSVVDLDEVLWRKVIDVNLTGTMIVSKYVAKQMIAQGRGGSIVSISSIAAMVAPATTGAYAASKAALHALNASLADELGPHGITCNVIAPGFLDTARVDALRAEGKWEQRLSSIPIKRPGTAEEVAELVRFLCGPHGRWISGEAIVVAGGEVRRAAR